jgi:glutamate synthase domain-containing protein 3
MSSQGDLVPVVWSHSGETGRNFAAGMSGGVAYIFDPAQAFPDRCNKGLVDLETVMDPAEQDELRGFVEEHVKYTGSVVGQRILQDWGANVAKFVKVGDTVNIDVRPAGYDPIVPGPPYTHRHRERVPDS